MAAIAGYPDAATLPGIPALALRLGTASHGLGRVARVRPGWAAAPA